MNDWGNVACVTRVYERADCGWMNCAFGLVQHGFRPGDVMMPAVPSSPAHTAFNTAAVSFLDSPELAHCDTLVTLDCDHIFPPDTLERLRSDPRGKPFAVLGALYIARLREFPLVMRLLPGRTWDDTGWNLDNDKPFCAYSDWQAGDVVRVDTLGFGFTLIRRAALQAVREANGNDNFAWYPWAEATEDVAFFRTLARTGMKAAVHTGVAIGHITRNLSVPYDDWTTHRDSGRVVV